MGASLLAVAKQYPDKNFIGIETHRPGIARVLQGLAAFCLTNVRLYEADAVEVFDCCLQDATLAGVQLFFPDPWPKRRHILRRLIQTEFIKKILSKLQPGGTLHIATDWEEYAMQMLAVLSQETAFCNVAGASQFHLERSCYRPLITKFEQRALREGRRVYELQFLKCGTMMT